MTTPPPGEADWERRLEDLARAQRDAVGRCGAESPSFGFLPNSICALPAGHAGWHREGPTEWGPRYGSTPLEAQDGSGRAEMGGRVYGDGSEAPAGAEGEPEVTEPKRAWMVTVGAYSDYKVLTVALNEADAQAYADAYNAARESLYRDDAQVEAVGLYLRGAPLPRRVTLWNANAGSEWSHTEITADPEGDYPQAAGLYGGASGPIAANYPTREAARAASDAYAVEAAAKETE